MGRHLVHIVFWSGIGQNVQKWQYLALFGPKILIFMGVSKSFGTKIFTPCPQKLDFGPKNGQIWPKTGIFAPFDLKPDQKTMQTSCLDGFLLCWYQNFYLLPQKLGFLAQKRPNLVQNMHFWSFWAKYCHFCTFCPMPDQKNNVNKVPRWVFRYVGNKTYDFSSKKKGFFAQKRPNLAQNCYFWLIWARPCSLKSMS